MNELTINNEMSFSDLQNIINKAFSMQNEKLHLEVKDLKENQEKLTKEVELSKTDNDNLRDMEISRHRSLESRFGFVSLNDLGQMYQTSIGSKTMGKLLRLSGIAKNKESKTEPFRSFIVNGYAKSQMYGDNVTYQYNPEKCITKIDKWLDSVGVVNEFYSIEDENKLMKYINELSNIYTEQEI